MRWRNSDSLQAGRSRYRIPVQAEFSVYVDPENHPTSWTMDTGTSLGVKRPEDDADHPPTSNAGLQMG
jgi:hypothetical protein